MFLEALLDVFFSSTPKKRTFNFDASNIDGPNNLAT